MTDLAETAKRFDLYTRDAEAARFVWRFRDSGIAVEPDAIAVMRAGRWSRAPFHAIRFCSSSASPKSPPKPSICLSVAERPQRRRRRTASFSACR